ncbi:unnamed protein product [Brachionus calyciflorus]|uniref:Uncharacterized protein n=1 Tax=Brachionus calyciflorus TaxID=104777 RepID=A0A813M729_9BILA|nr:unnamed protein product [Brachionus calyciflorus]
MKNFLFVLNFCLISQALTAPLAQDVSLLSNKRNFKIANRGRLDKRESIHDLKSNVPRFFGANKEVNVVPLRMKISEIKKAVTNDDHRKEQKIVEFSENSSPKYDLDELKRLYESAISNLRAETIGSNNYIQKKSNIAEKELDKVLRNVEQIINNRIELSFYSIQAKMEQAKSALSQLSNKVINNIDSKMENMLNDLSKQINKEKNEIEEKIVSFNQKLALLSEKLESTVQPTTQAIVEEIGNHVTTISSTSESSDSIETTQLFDTASITQSETTQKTESTTTDSTITDGKTSTEAIVTTLEPEITNAPEVTLIQANEGPSIVEEEVPFTSKLLNSENKLEEVLDQNSNEISSEQPI